MLADRRRRAHEYDALETQAAPHGNSERRRAERVADRCAERSVRRRERFQRAHEIRKRRPARVRSRHGPADRTTRRDSRSPPAARRSFPSARRARPNRERAEPPGHAAGPACHTASECLPATTVSRRASIGCSGAARVTRRQREQPLRLAPRQVGHHPGGDREIGANEGPERNPRTNDRAIYRTKRMRRSCQSPGGSGVRRSGRDQSLESDARPRIRPARHRTGARRGGRRR